MAISVGSAVQTNSSSPARSRPLRLRTLQVTVSLAVAAFVFRGVLPHIADYSAAWASIKGIGWLALVGLIAVTVLHFGMYWPQMMASLPGLTLAQASVSNQTSTTVANTVPGGGMVAVGVSYTMFRAWGFSDAEIALSTGVTFVWNIFAKLSLPVIALVALAIAGRAGGGMLVASSAGVAMLSAAVGILALMLWKETVARRVGVAVGFVQGAWRRLTRKPCATNWGEAGVRFRSDTIRLVSARWAALTVTTLAGNLALYLVVLLALRAVGVSGPELTWTQILGVFALVRLLSAFPITPGGVGLVELGYIGGLVLAASGNPGGSTPEIHAQITAAVLIVRGLTYLLPIPLGGLTYLVWRRKQSWRGVRPLAAEAFVASSPVASPRDERPVP
jgi:putative heme transporter